MLLATVDHAVDNVAVRDRVCRLGEQLEVLERAVGAIEVADQGWVRLGIVLLDEEWHKRNVVEEELHLFAQGLLVGTRERIRSSELLGNGKRRHDGVFLVHLEAGHVSFIRKQVNLHLLAFVKVHLALAQLERGEHVEDLANVRAGTTDKLVHNVGRNLEFLPGRLETYWAFKDLPVQNGEDARTDLRSLWPWSLAT